MVARVKAMEDHRLMLRGIHCIGIPRGERVRGEGERGHTRVEV